MNGKKQTARATRKSSPKPQTIEQRAADDQTHRLLAERVLGWRFHTHRATSGVFSHNNRTTFDVWKDANGDDAAIVAEWSPTTKITDAWLIVDKLQEEFWLELKSPFEAGDEWFAGFTPLGASGWNGTPDFSSKGETAPLAICLATLAIFAERECFEDCEPTEQN